MVTNISNQYHLFFLKVEDQNDIETVKASVSGGVPVKEKKPTHHDSKNEVRTEKGSFARISPSAKLLITEHGLDPSSLTSSGPRGTLLKGDVLSAIKSGKGSTKTTSTEKKMAPSAVIQPQTSSLASAGLGSSVEESSSYEDLPNSQIRKVFFLIKLLCTV